MIDHLLGPTPDDVLAHFYEIANSEIDGFVAGCIYCQAIVRAISESGPHPPRPRANPEPGGREQ